MASKDWLLLTPALVLLASLPACSGDPGASARDAGTDAGERPDGTVEDAGVGMIDIVVGDLRFDARVDGPANGELVIMLHGFPQTSYEWRSQLVALAGAGYRAVAPDQRGFSAGARPANIEDYRIPLLAQDVLDMADALGAERFHVVGHDFGAWVAWVVASIGRDRVLSLTALSVPHPDGFAAQLANRSSCQFSASAYIQAFTRPGAEASLVSFDGSFVRTAVLRGVAEEVADEYLRVLGTEDAMGAALNWYRANVPNRMPTVGPLGLIEVPTLLIWSDGDTFVCRESADSAASYVTGAYQFEVLEGVDHWLTDNAPDDVNALLLPHLAAHGAP